jgi:aminoglycoside phosphotransferase (APT) family kinase protein
MTARVDWPDLPSSLRAAIEHEVGGRVHHVENAAGGFSPGFAARVHTDDGALRFVKAIASPGWRFLYEREARIAPLLPDGAPFPRWRFTIQEGDWIALGFDVIDGREASIPWSTRDLERVHAAHLTMTERLDPSPVPVEEAGEMWGDWFSRWRDFARDDELAHALPDGWTRHLDELAGLEAAWPACTVGQHLVHLDLRADNVLLTDREVYVVDWAFAARGQPWMDLVCLYPNVALGGGPDPETLWQRHPWHAATDPLGFDAFLAGWAGMLTHLVLGTASPALASLRRLHAEQAAAARGWLARRRGWDDLRAQSGSTSWSRRKS